MEKKKYDYYRVIIRKAEQILELLSLDEFVRYAQAHQIRQIIKANDFETGVPSFALTSRGALYICNAQGYEWLEDYQTATENKFPDAATFYEARTKNCTTFAEYETVLSTGITDTAVFDEMKKQGYIDGYPGFEQTRKQNTTLPPLPQITNVKELYEFAQQKKFEDFKQFKKVYDAGFADLIEYEMAIEKGLNNATDFATFKQGGFETLEEFKLAKPLEIRSREELYQNLNLKAGNYPDSSFDELLLLNIISKLEQKSKTAFQKLYDHFVKTEEGYKRTQPNGELQLPKWFTKRLRKESDVKEFLTGSDFVKLFGTFDAEKNEFETISIKRRKVVVDGSNVAFNSNMADRKLGVYNADLNNILLLVKKLKEEYEFHDVHVIVDASLVHKAKDKSVLPEIKTRCKFSEAPGGTPADLHLIAQVKKHHCLLVTNDTFKDWKLNDRWLADNIDFYRLKFVINGDIVMLPYMDRFK